MNLLLEVYPINSHPEFLFRRYSLNPQNFLTRVLYCDAKSSIKFEIGLNFKSKHENSKLFHFGIQVNICLGLEAEYKL
jgi:hypothetical protein